MFQKVVDSKPNGVRILETLECGHVIDSMTPSEEVDCIACDIEFVAATPERLWEMRAPALNRHSHGTTTVKFEK